MKFETLIEIPQDYNFGRGGGEICRIKEILNFSHIVTSVEQNIFSESETNKMLSQNITLNNIHNRTNDILNTDCDYDETYNFTNGNNS